MYFRIGSITPDVDYSWILVKNPTSIFNKALTKDGQCSVQASFDKQIHYYTGYIYNHPITFLEIARKLNMSNYLHTQLSAVCPYNLRGFDAVFRSVLRGDWESSSIPKERYFAPKTLEALIGPYPCNKEFISQIFGDYGIATEFGEETTASHMVQFKVREPMSVTEFFQKIYLISYFLTISYALTPINTEQIAKFANLCKDWLEESTLYRNRIINTLCKRNMDLIKHFEFHLTEDKEEVEHRFEKISAEKAQRLHELRHQLILDNIPEHRHTSLIKIIDMGCADGKLLKKISKSEIKENSNTIYIGIDADNIKIERAKRQNKNIRFVHSNILFPINIEEIIDVDYMILTEIIEHLNTEDRIGLIGLINNTYMPKTFILTTPNIDYNINYEIPEGEYRHSDHKIEYNTEQFTMEVVVPLTENYDIIFLKVAPEETVQPSFTIIGKRREGCKPNHKKIRRIKERYDQVHLDISNYTINHSELNIGYTNRAFLSNNSNIFYIAPTMAPIDYNPQFPDYLEHPQTCFDYYRNRGISTLIGQGKYMGSRACLLIFKDAETADRMGFMPITINSKSGFAFFEDKSVLGSIHSDIRTKMDSDFIILDAEILPWSIKAKKLIFHDFLGPIESAILARKYSNIGSLENAIKTLKSLNNYTQNTPLEVRSFHVLAKGSVDLGKRKFTNVVVGTQKNHIWHMTEIRSLIGEIHKSCNYHIVELNDYRSQQESIKLWEEYCEKGEGFVYKPINFLNYTPDNYIIQPAIKVRGREYLRIIYGIDYLEPECLAALSHRKTLKKRTIAIQEQELSMKILLSFLKQNKPITKKYIAAFLGMESTNMSNIDATL